LSRDLQELFELYPSMSSVT